MSCNASASSGEQDWTEVRARRQDRHANRPTVWRKSEWICKRCAAAGFMSYQSCGKCHVVRDGSEEVVPGLDMTTDKDQPVVLAMGNEPAGSKVAQLKKLSQLEGTYRVTKREERTPSAARTEPRTRTKWLVTDTSAKRRNTVQQTTSTLASTTKSHIQVQSRSRPKGWQRRTSEPRKTMYRSRDWCEHQFRVVLGTDTDLDRDC